MSSARPVTRGRPGQGRFPSFPDRANPNVATGQHGPALSEGGNRIGNDFSDEPRLVFIGLGTIAMPFLFIPFHGGYYGQQAV